MLSSIVLKTTHVKGLLLQECLCVCVFAHFFSLAIMSPGWRMIDILNCKCLFFLFFSFLPLMSFLFHSHGRRNFFLGKMESFEGTSTHVTAPRRCFTHTCKKPVLVSSRLSWRIIGTLALHTPLLTQSCLPLLGPCTAWNGSDPDERKSCEQI